MLFVKAAERLAQVSYQECCNRFQTNPYKSSKGLFFKPFLSYIIIKYMLKGGGIYEMRAS